MEGQGSPPPSEAIVAPKAAKLDTGDTSPVGTAASVREPIVAPTEKPDSRVKDPQVVADPDRTRPFIPPAPDTDNETAPLTTTAESSSTASQDRQEAHDVAENIIDAKINEIKQKYTNGDRVDTASMTKSEFDIYSIYILHSRGFTKSELKAHPTGIPLFDGNGLAITGKGNDGEEITTTALAIKEQKVDTRGRLVAYDCYTTDPPDPTKIVTVKPAELTKSFMAKIVPSIAESVEPEQQPIVEWYAQGENGTPPNEAVKKEKDPMVLTNRVITKRIQELRADIDTLSKGKRAEREGAIARLEFALKSDGEDFGAFVKMEALKTIGNDKMGTPDGKKVAEVMNALKEKAELAKTNLKNALKEKGINDKQIDKLLASGLSELLKDGGLMNTLKNVPNLEQKLFGTNTPSDAEVDAMADKHLTPEQKAEAKKYGKGGVLLAILLSILASPLIIAGGAAMATPGAVKILAGANR